MVIVMMSVCVRTVLFTNAVIFQRFLRKRLIFTVAYLGLSMEGVSFIVLNFN
jgi:hypothetical protein